MSDDASILYDLDAATGVAVLRLNRPTRFNAFNLEMIGRWARTLETVERDPHVRALIVTGEGKAFCSGGDADDLEGFISMDAPARKAYLWENVHRIPLLLERIRCPVIAAINGAARGAGLDMALMCDLRVMDVNAVVAESYITMGLVPGDGGAWLSSHHSRTVLRQERGAESVLSARLRSTCPMELTAPEECKARARFLEAIDEDWKDTFRSGR